MQVFFNIFTYKSIILFIKIFINKNFKIKIEIKDLKDEMFEDFFEEKALSNENSLMAKLIKDIVSKVNKLPCFVEPTYLLNKEEAKTCYVEADNLEDITIELYMYDNKELLDYYTLPENVLGFQAINSGIFESIDSDFINNITRTLIKIA